MCFRIGLSHQDEETGYRHAGEQQGPIRGFQAEKSALAGITLSRIISHDDALPDA